MTINILQTVRHKKNFEKIKSANKKFILNYLFFLNNNIFILLYISRNL